MIFLATVRAAVVDDKLIRIKNSAELWCVFRLLIFFTLSNTYSFYWCSNSGTPGPQSGQRRYREANSAGGS